MWVMCGRSDDPTQHDTTVQQTRCSYPPCDGYWKCREHRFDFAWCDNCEKIAIATVHVRANGQEYEKNLCARHLGAFKYANAH